MHYFLQQWRGFDDPVGQYTHAQHGGDHQHHGLINIRALTLRNASNNA